MFFDINNVFFSCNASKTKRCGGSKTVNYSLIYGLEYFVTMIADTYRDREKSEGKVELESNYTHKQLQNYYYYTSFLLLLLGFVTKEKTRKSIQLQLLKKFEEDGTESRSKGAVDALGRGEKKLIYSNCIQFLWQTKNHVSQFSREVQFLF